MNRTHSSAPIVADHWATGDAQARHVRTCHRVTRVSFLPSIKSHVKCFRSVFSLVFLLLSFHVQSETCTKDVFAAQQSVCCTISSHFARLSAARVGYILIPGRLTAFTFACMSLLARECVRSVFIGRHRRWHAIAHFKVTQPTRNQHRNGWAKASARPFSFHCPLYTHDQRLMCTRTHANTSISLCYTFWWICTNDMYISYICILCIMYNSSKGISWTGHALHKCQVLPTTENGWHRAARPAASARARRKDRRRASEASGAAREKM